MVLRDWVAIVDPFSGWYRSWRSRGARAATGKPRWCTSPRSWASRFSWCGAATISSCGGCVWRRSCSPRRRVGWMRHWFGVAGRAAPRGMGWSCSRPTSRACRGERPVKAQIRAVAIQRFDPMPRGRRSRSWGARSLGSGLRVAGQRRGTGMGRGSTPRHRAVRAALLTPQGRAIAQFARFLAAAVDSSGGGGARVAVGCALPRARVGAAGWANVAGAAAMSHRPLPPTCWTTSSAPSRRRSVWTSEWPPRPSAPCTMPGTGC